MPKNPTTKEATDACRAAETDNPHKSSAHEFWLFQAHNQPEPYQSTLLKVDSRQ